MMAKRGRGKRKSGGSGALLVTLGIVCILLSAAIVGGYAYLRVQASSQIALNKETLCPVSGPRAITAVLLDVTDPISDATATDLRNKFQGLVNNVPVGGLIEVYTLTEVPGELTQTFRGCNPGSGETVDQWTSNPRLAQERWKRGFEEPLKGISERLAKGTAGKQSPIMAGIQEIGLETFGLPSYQAIPKVLVVASDMIEHTDSFSMYRDGPSYAKYQDSVALAKFRTPLEGIDVRILQFQRTGLRFTDEDLAGFWKNWIDGNRGSFGGYTRMQGVM